MSADTDAPDTRDPIDDLRRLWRRLEPSLPDSLGQNGDSLERAEPTTRASVEWLRAAWSNLPIPAARPPRRLQLIMGGRWRWVPVLRRVEPIQVAAAALLLVSAVVSYQWVQRTSGSRSHSPPIVAQSIDERETLPEPRPLGLPAANPLAPLNASSLLPGATGFPPNYGGMRIAIFFSNLLPPLTPQPGADDTVARLLQVVHLYHRGAWSEAAERAREILTTEALSTEHRCVALNYLALSLRANGRPDEAATYSAELERELGR